MADMAWVDEILAHGGTVEDVKRRAREMKLEQQGFRRDKGGGWVRAGRSPADPDPAQHPTVAQKLGAAFSPHEMMKDAGAMAAAFNENFAFGLPATAMDVAGLSSPGERQRLMSEAHPAASVGGQVAGLASSGVAGPERMIAESTTAAANMARQAAPVLGRTALGRMGTAAAEGAVSGAATGGAAALAHGRSLAAAGEEALTGGQIGGALGVGISAAGEAKRKFVGSAIDDLKQRIVNEIAEGDASKASTTSRKRLERADESIFEEVVDGPDADVTRGAYLSRPSAGRKKLAPIIQRISEENQAAYGALEKAGRSNLDPSEYDARLAAVQQNAVETGDEQLERVVGAFRERVADQVQKNGGRLTLPQLRKLTTQAQGVAESALGSIHEHTKAAIGRRLSGVVTEAMDETLSAAAAGVPELESAAATIRSNNRRLHGQLGIDNALKLRATKEASGAPWSVRAANVAAGAGATGGAIEFAMSHDPLHAAGSALGAAALKYGLPAGARAIERARTTAAINQARRGGPGVSAPALPASVASNPVARQFFEANAKEKERDRKRLNLITGRK